MGKIIAVDIRANTKEAVANVDNFNKSLDKTKTDISGVSSLADKATGGMASKFKAAIGSVKGLATGFKTLRGAIISTGIGALVVALGSLISYFTNTQAGADKLSVAMDGIKAAFSAVVDRISSFGGAIVKFFSGDFAGAVNDVTAAFSGLGNEIVREFEAAQRLRDELNKLKDEEIDLIEVNAKRRKSIAENRLIAEDETIAIRKRISALNEASRLENAILDDQLRIAKERARISQEQLDLGESSREEIRENAELQAKVYELEERSLLQQKSIATRRNALIRQANAEESKEREGLVGKRKALTKIETDSTIKGIGNQLNAYKKAKDQEVAIEKMTQEMKFNLVSGALANLATIVGENSKFGKAIAVVQAIRDTYAGANTALASAPPPFNFISAAAVVASGIANVKAITSTRTPRVPSRLASTGGGGSAAVSAPSVSQSLPPSFNTVGTSGINQLAASIKSKPMKAYVVSKDISTAQELDRNKVDSASI
jgi:hypothetical protein